MISKFFIDRPIFTTVLFLIMAMAAALVGAVVSLLLPVTEYPDLGITLPTIEVSAAYPGANAQVVADTVAAPIEQHVNDIEGMLHMSSHSAHDGVYSLTVAFRPGTDLDIAQVLVQNRVRLAEPILPDLVKRRGMTVKKKPAGLLLIVNLFSPDGSRDSLYLGNYAAIQIREELARLPGVGDITSHGLRDHRMRLWLAPGKLAALGLTADEVVAALRAQNLQVDAGPGQRFRFSLAAFGRLAEPDQLADMILLDRRATRVHLKDVGSLEWGTPSPEQACTLDGKSSVALFVYPLPGASALETAGRVRARMEELKTRFPDGIDYAVVHDTSRFTPLAIRAGFNALGIAAVAVALGLLLFVRSWRSSLVALAAVFVGMPVSFVVLAAVSGSLNTLTLLGLVLALGICVQDATAVVAAVAEHVGHGMAPRAAAAQAAAEVSRPVLAVALVLAALFVPCLFAGPPGAFFRQFALTLAVAALVSACVAQTLCPTLCAVLFWPTATGDIRTRPSDLLARGCTGAVRLALRGTVVVLVLYAGLLALTWWGFGRLPTGQVPPQDRGFLFVGVHLPRGASERRTRETVQRLEAIALRTPGVRHTLTFSGRSALLGAGSPSSGALCLVLDDFDRRADPELSQDAVAERLREQFRAEVLGAVAHVFGMPSVQGMDAAGGFTLIIQDSGDNSRKALREAADRFVAAGNADPRLRNLSSSPAAATPWMELIVDRAQAKDRGVSIGAVCATLEATLGPCYVNDFNRFGRTWQIHVQAPQDPPLLPEDIKQMRAPNGRGELVPLAAFISVRQLSEPATILRYNRYESVAVHGIAAPGVSSDQAVAALERLVWQELRAPMGYQWERQPTAQPWTGDTFWVVFAFTLFGVFLVLAAQYESWSLPLAVILTVPMGLLGLVAGVTVARSDVNLFTQLGLVVLVGLASKNALLIVEFAKVKHKQGMTRAEATLEACRLRLRPILMTSFAIILGAVPLILGTGAGAEMRRALGVAVFSGMLGVTLFVIFLTPVFFCAIDWLGGAAGLRKPPARLALRCLLWVFVGLGFLVEGLLLLSAWWAGAVSLRVLLLLVAGMVTFLVLSVLRAVVRTAGATGALATPGTGEENAVARRITAMPSPRSSGDEHVRRD